MDDKYKKTIIQLINNIRFIYFSTGFMIGLKTMNQLGESLKASTVIIYPIVSALTWLPVTIADIVIKMWM
ncbi:hypothetical protein ACR77J_07130 [Tissierella praeacuta]|uniref:hypothetical protein n=1 Tax=Tissierella praeacuta TaxID=43131 RepID=UPI003DA30032